MLKRDCGLQTADCGLRNEEYADSGYLAPGMPGVLLRMRRFIYRITLQLLVSVAEGPTIVDPPAGARRWRGYRSWKS